MTGGGDAPGLNSIIESVGRVLLSAGHELVGICDGFEGIFDDRHIDLKATDLAGLHTRSGTLLGTSNKSRIEGREKEFQGHYERLRLNGLVVAGGDGTFSALSRIGKGIPLVALPKTIDNDLQATDITFGFDTACSVVSEAVDALRASADGHRRVMIVETMGRTAGWISLGGGLASYADAIFIPERPVNPELFVAFLREKQRQNRRGLVLVVSESATFIGGSPQTALLVEGSPEPTRFGGVSEKLARFIEAQTGWESRHVILGHLQRSKAPTTTDRFLTAAMGVEAARRAIMGDWNKAVVYVDGRITVVPITDVQGPPRVVPANHRWVELAKALGIFI